jgi:catechol 2,3-dioxygenase-like lactoylglutathione lyase family enzyme
MNDEKVLMIEALDHIQVASADVPAAVAGYEAVLGATSASGRLQLGNMALRIVTGGAGQPDLGLAFAVADLDAAVHRLGRRAVPCTLDGTARARLDRGATHQVAIDLVERRAAADPSGSPPDISGLDHVVVRTGDPERAVALYAGRLGLDLRLDRTNPERGNRLLFFVCGDLVVEVSHDTRKGVVPGPDSIWGLAWRAIDLRPAHARMSTAGIAVSEIRTGNRPGTEVFTVKSHTADVPTLVIGGHGLVRR